MKHCPRFVDILEMCSQIQSKNYSVYLSGIWNLISVENYNFIKLNRFKDLWWNQKYVKCVEQMRVFTKGFAMCNASGFLRKSILISFYSFCWHVTRILIIVIIRQWISIPISTPKSVTFWFYFFFVINFESNQKVYELPQLQ